MQQINQSHEFEQELQNSNKTIALYFYGDFSEISKKVLKEMKSISSEVKDATFFSVNVSENKELHKKYNVKSVPTLVLFREKQAVEWIQGEQNRNYIINAVNGETFIPKATKSSDGPSMPRIEVYSTPTCTFCTKLKDYLKKVGFPYRDIDIAKDSKAGEDLVKRTGQQGVPQTFINGQLVVGFDQKKIDKLLGI